MDLTLDAHAGWTLRPGCAGPPTPRRLAIAANPGGNYGNVRKLPDLLWEYFAMDLADHWTTPAEAASGAPVDVVLSLTDLGGGSILQPRGRMANEVRVASRATWSDVRTAMLAIRQPLQPGADYMPPPKPAKRRAAIVDVDLVEATPVPRDPLDSLRDAIRLLIEQAEAADLAALSVSWTDGEAPRVEVRRFVVQTLEVK